MSSLPASSRISATFSAPRDSLTVIQVALTGEVQQLLSVQICDLRPLHCLALRTAVSRTLSVDSSMSTALQFMRMSRRIFSQTACRKALAKALRLQVNCALDTSRPRPSYMQNRRFLGTPSCELMGLPEASSPIEKLDLMKAGMLPKASAIELKA